MAIPSQFFGVWTSEKNDNFDEYLGSADVPWILRKAIMLAGENITMTNLGNGRYRAEHSMMGQSAKYDFSLNEEFEIKGMDGITATVDGSKFIEAHIMLDKPNRPIDRHVYTVEDGRLVQSLSNEKCSCRRYFKRKN